MWYWEHKHSPGPPDDAATDSLRDLSLRPSCPPLELSKSPFLLSAVSYQVYLFFSGCFLKLSGLHVHFISIFFLYEQKLSMTTVKSIKISLCGLCFVPCLPNTCSKLKTSVFVSTPGPFQFRLCV